MLWEGDKMGIQEMGRQERAQLFFSLINPLATPGGSDTRKHHRAAGEVLLMNYSEATSSLAINQGKR